MKTLLPSEIHPRLYQKLVDSIRKRCTIRGLSYAGAFLLILSALLTFHTSGASRQTPKKVLIALISLGDHPGRADIIHSHIQLVKESKINSKYEIDCVLHTFSRFEDYPQWAKDLATAQNAPCSVVSMYKTNYVSFLKTLNPSWLQMADYDYLTITLDDVVLTPPHGHFEMEPFHDIMVEKKLAMASPAIAGSNHLAMRPQEMKKHQVGRFINAIEIQSTTFRLDAWKCFYELLDTEYPSGWGVDVWYYNYCVQSGRVTDRMAIIDSMIAHLNPYQFETTMGGNSAMAELMAQQAEAWERLRNITFVPTYPALLEESEIWDANHVEQSAN